MLITTNADLQDFCNYVKQKDCVAVDTEFLRDRTYFPRLCLIQMATDDRAVAIDPLAENLDLSLIFPIFNNKKIVKIFHSARQDLEIMIQLTGKMPANVFDTQVAAMACGFGEAVSYETIVHKLLSASIDKRYRFTDWSMRPLSESQLHYALNDVIYLIKIYHELRAQLASDKRIEWLNEEMAALTKIENYQIIPENAWLKLKTKCKTPKFLRLVKEIAQWRELKAQKLDLPRNHLLKEEALLEVAAFAPTTIEDLKKIRNLGSKVTSSANAKELVKVIENALAMPGLTAAEMEPMHKKHHNSDAASLLQLLKLLLHIISQQHNVAEKMIATGQDLLEFATANPEHQAKHSIMQGWRFEVFGQFAEQLQQGKLALTFEQGKIKLLTI